jgi:hypothetical protein
VQNCLFPVPYPVGIARPPPKNLLPPLRADNVADWTVAARQNHPKLVIKKMYDTEVERSLLELAEAFDKEVTDAGLIVLRKLFHFHTVDPAIWSKRFFSGAASIPLFQTRNRCRAHIALPKISRGNVIRLSFSHFKRNDLTFMLFFFLNSGLVHIGVLLFAKDQG